MAKTTPATQALTKAGVAFAMEQYEYHREERHREPEHIALKAAEAVNEPPARVLKTLMVMVDGKPFCAVVPSDKELAMKKVAAAFGGKSAEMLKPADAERLTGYHVGGISPFGQRKKVPVAFAVQVLDQPYVIINGGGRGVMVRLAPKDAQKAVGAIAADITA